MRDDLAPVLTIDDWYDGPIAGATEYRGTPHYYRAAFLDDEPWRPDGEGAERFELIPLPATVLAAILEAAQLHQRWVDAERAGTLPPVPDPEDLRVLPSDR